MFSTLPTCWPRPTVPELTLPAHLEGNSGEVVFPGPAFSVRMHVRAASLSEGQPWYLGAVRQRRPIQCKVRFPATQDHKIIGIGHDMSFSIAVFWNGALTVEV